MCVYIGIEDLAANALIEIMSKNSNARFVSYSELEKYGAEVIKFLNSKGEKAILILSRENTNDLFRNYSDIFEEDLNNGISGIKLRSKITVEDLINKFRGYLAWDVLLAFIDKQTVATLGV